MPLAAWQKMRTAAKIVAVLAGAGLVGLSVSWISLSLVISPSFESLESQGVVKQIGRAESMLETELLSLESSVKDYAVWDDSYHYIETADQAFRDETFTTLALVNLGINGMAYVRFGHRWGT